MSGVVRSWFRGFTVNQGLWELKWCSVGNQHLGSFRGGGFMNTFDFYKKIYGVGAPIGIATALTFSSFGYQNQQIASTLQDIGEGLILAQGSTATVGYINITPT